MRSIVILIFCFSFFFTVAQEIDQAYIDLIDTYRTEHLESLWKNDRAPLNEEDLDDVKFFDLDKMYKINCAFTLTPDTEVFQMATYSGNQKPYRKYGFIRFEIEGQIHELAIYQSQNHLNHPVYKDYLFLPFKDITNDDTSYGGGRYLDIRLSEIVNGHIFIDFNKVYNPWCAYSAGFNCPVPPVENHLDIPIFAGERNFEGEYKPIVITEQNVFLKMYGKKISKPLRKLGHVNIVANSGESIDDLLQKLESFKEKLQTIPQR